MLVTFRSSTTMSPSKKTQMPRWWVSHHPMQLPDIPFLEDAWWGFCHALGIDVWSGPGSSSLVKESTTHWRNFEHAPLLSPELNSQKQGFHFLIKARCCYAGADCSPVVTLLLPPQHLYIFTVSGWHPPTPHWMLWGSDQGPGTQAFQDHALVLLISEVSPSPQIGPVPSFCLLSISFFYRHISLLLTNNQSDWFDSWYNQVWRSRILSQCSEGMEETGIFLGKKISSQSEARVTASADRLSMCVLYTGPKRFQRLNQMLCLLSLFPLSNFTFAIEKEMYLSLPDNTEIYDLPSPTEKGGNPHQATTQLSALPSAPPGDTWIF